MFLRANWPLCHIVLSLQESTIYNNSMPPVLPADLEIGFALIIFCYLQEGQIPALRDVNESIRHWHQVTHDHVRTSDSGSHKLGNCGDHT